MKINSPDLTKAYGYAKLNEQGDKQKGNYSIARDNNGNLRTHDTIEISGTKGTALSAHQNTYRNINDLDSSRIVRFDRLKPEESASQTENETTATVQAAAYKATASATTTNSTINVGNINIAQIEADIRKELEKDADFMKENGLDFELVFKGKVYETVSKITGEDHMNLSVDDYLAPKTIGNFARPFYVPDENSPGSFKAVDRDSDEAKSYVNQLIEARGKANDAYAKYKEIKASSPNTASAVSASADKGAVDIGSINISQLEADIHKDLEKDTSLMKENGLDFNLVLKGKLYEMLSNLTGKDYMNLSVDDFLAPKTIGNMTLPMYIPDENNSGSYKAVDRNSDEAKSYVNQLIEERGKANDAYAKYKELTA